jgi:biopolymer transport protein ExbB/TolQ
MEISRNLNCKQNKKEIDRLERKLDKLKLIANETDEINAQIKQLEGLIKNYYNKKTEAAKIRSRVKWAEEGEKSTRYFFNLEKKRGQEKLNLSFYLFPLLTILFCFSQDPTIPVYHCIYFSQFSSYPTKF